MEDLLLDYLSLDLAQAGAAGKDLVQRICDEMDNPEQVYSIQDLIESLESSLTSHMEKERWKATLLLAEIFAKKNFAADELTSSVLHLFLIFFCRRCTDFPSITPSLQAIMTILQKYGSQLDGKYCDVLDIVLTIVKEIHIPSYAQNIRQLALDILMYIFQQDLGVSQLMRNSMEVVDGVVNTMEEEKDPRCLLLALKLIAKVSIIFQDCLEESIATHLQQLDSDYETLAEKIFDNISCYFPISFTPPPDDPFGITTEDLVDALEQAMCSSLPIIKYTIPFFIEQINSELVSARVHALHGLLKIVRENGHVWFRQRSIDIRSGRMSELLSGEQDERKPYLLRLSQLVFDIACVEASDEIVEAVYRLVAGITYSISKDLTGKYAADWQTFHGYILTKVHNELLKSPTSMDSLKMKAMWKLTLVIATGGGCFTSSIIVKQFLPILIERVQRTFSMNQLNLQRYLQAAAQNVKILTSFTNEERIVPSSIQMLESLITSSLPLTMDITAMQDLHPLREYQDVLYDTLSSFVLKVREVIISASVSATTMDTDVEEEVKANKLDADISLALMMSTHAMAELCLRSKGQRMDVGKVNMYLGVLMEVAIRGFPALLSSSLAKQVEGRLNLVDENTMLQSAAGDLFVKLINVQTSKESFIDFQTLIITSCFPHLLQSVVTIPRIEDISSAEFCAGLQKRCQLLSKLIIANTNATVWQETLKALLPAMVGALRNMVGSQVDANMLKTSLFMLQQWLDIVVSVLPREVSGEGLSILQSKVNCLLRCKDGDALDVDTSPLLQLAQALLALPSFVAETKEVQQKVVLIQQSFDLIVATTMSYSTLIQQDVFYKTLSTMLSTTNPNRSSEVLLALLCHHDKQGQCFQSSTSSNSASPFTGFQLANIILERLLSSTSSKHVESDAKCFAVIINKLQDQHEVAHLLQNVTDVVQARLQPSSNQAVSDETMQVFIWTLKAITLRPALIRVGVNKTWQETFLATFMTCLSADSLMMTSTSITLAEYCANQMMVLIQEPAQHSANTINILTKTSKGHFNMFWQQKLYLTIYPIFSQKLNDMLITNTPSLHWEVLTAICKLIQGISTQLLKSNISDLKQSLMKILSFLHLQDQSSSQFNNGQQTGTTKIATEAVLALQRMMQEDVSIFLEQLHIIIPRLLQIAQHHSEAKIRAAALECLAILPIKVSYPNLHPHRKAVEKGLLHVLDDKKRAVRQLASKVRNDWMLIE